MLKPGTFARYNREETSIGKNTLCMVLAYKGKTPMVQLLGGKLAGSILYIPEGHLTKEHIV